MTDAPRSATSPSASIDPARHTVWWLATWLGASVAGSIVLVALYRVTPGDGVALATPLGVVAASLAALWTVQMLGMVLASRSIGSGDPVADYGLRARPIDLLGVPLGVAAQLVLVPLLYLPLRALDGDTFSDERLEDTARDLVAQADGAVIVLLIGLVVIGAPVVEEIFYRGMLQRPLLVKFGPWIAVPVVSLVFGAIHLRPVEFVGLAAAGAVFGTCAALTDRVGMAIAAHVAFNATGVVAVL